MKTSIFRIGQKYKRKDIYSILGIPEDTKGGTWDTGANKYQKDWFLFCNIGTPGRTGHDYKNRFIGDDLLWFGKTGSKISHPSIKSMIRPEGEVYIFYRENDRESFSFAGSGRAKSWKDTIPAQIIWEFPGFSEERPEILPQEVVNADKYYEGATKTITVNIYERDPNAREKCIENYGLKCYVCNTDFERIYGELGKGFIHVHHIKPLAEIGESYEVDPINDLRPLCPNCHAMIHRKKPALTIDVLKTIYKTNMKQ